MAKKAKKPKYKKIDIEISKPPIGYWEAGIRRCLTCQKDWPNFLMFDPSPCCHGDTLVDTEGTPPTWRVVVKEFLQSRFDTFYREWVEQEAAEEVEALEHIEEEFALNG